MFRDLIVEGALTIPEEDLTVEAERFLQPKVPGLVVEKVDDSLMDWSTIQGAFPVAW